MGESGCGKGRGFRLGVFVNIYYEMLIIKKVFVVMEIFWGFMDFHEFS